ncbi:MAG: thioesterase family protein [Burkholderiaceae bacterium]|nr:thioesterase family protein [Burkholderiaceae bacterium]
MMVAGTASAPRSPAEQQRLHEALRDLFEERIAFNRVLGIRVESFDATEVHVSFEMRPEFVGHYLYGRLHGGVISSVLDAAGGFALMCAIAEKFHAENTEQVMQRFARMGTIDLRVDFLRQGIGRRFDARARTTRLGGRIGSVQCTLEDDTGRLIATASAAYVVS